MTHYATYSRLIYNITNLRVDRVDVILHPTLRVELLTAYQAFVFASFKLTLCK